MTAEAEGNNELTVQMYDNFCHTSKLIYIFMKNSKEVLEFESAILKREMSKPKWYNGFCSQTNASKMKLRLEQKTLHRNTIADIMEWLGYEKVVDPVDAMYRKLEIRTWKVYEEGSLIDTVKANTKDEAIAKASKAKYGETDTFTDQKGRVKFVWELNMCDIIAEEVI